ncbi:hypothetical protein M407DRAFT_221015 [Tulasnella calospora MUT 4182]|uniref:Uncharacterized protein n=1 Tax=Tulasnella calospora MUT 4182 TaxID=1051891 RepID=A0A0C3QRA0_9AGAM|nr:hypothetical protein M407DRAFT_221015 [Tulasnella calospora MUT 4182]
MSHPTRRDTSATYFPRSPTEMLEGDGGFGLNEERLGYTRVPYRNFVDTLSLPSTIGTAIAASAAFTILSADSIMGDSSPEAMARQREMVVILAWASGLYAGATSITVCLQAIYGSPSFCKVLIKKLNFKTELRTKYKPWPSWDFMRYGIAYGVVCSAYLALVMHLAATILIVGLFRPYGPTWLGQVWIVLIFMLALLVWAISVALEQHHVREKWRKILRLPPAQKAPSPEQPIVQSPQAEPKTFQEISSY